MPAEPAEPANTWTLTDAKARLSALVQRALDGQPQRIVRNGRDTVVVVAASSYREPAPQVSLVELFSALRGANLDLDRVRDEPRDVDL